MEKIKFLIQTEKNPAMIYVRFVNGREFDAKARTNQMVNPADWDNKTGWVIKDKTAEYKALRYQLEKLEDLIKERYEKRDADTTINKEWIEDAINGVNKDTKDIPDRLADYYDYYKKLKKGKVSYTTFKKLDVQKQVIIGYEISNKNTPVKIEHVSPDFISKFEDYCMNQKFSPNTIAQLVKSIKTICYHAQKFGDKKVHNKLSLIEYSFKPTKVIFLTPDEIKTLKKAKFNDATLDAARDWLIISCETAQRVSDFMRFKKAMISHNKSGSVISFVQKKTGTKMEIGLSDNVLSILKKRNGDFPPAMSEQYYNDRIKMVCEYAGINEIIEDANVKQKVQVGEKKDKNGKLVPVYKQRNIVGDYPKWQLVCSHIGRRSFASNYYGKLELAEIMEQTGHTTEKQLLAYIGKAGKATKAGERANKMNRFKLY